MNACARLPRFLLPALTVLLGVACAPADDDATEGAESALETPRDQAEKAERAEQAKKNGPTTRIQALAAALEKATANDFRDIAANRDYFEDVLAYARKTFDPKAAAFRFHVPHESLGGTYYVVDIRSADRKVFWIYEEPRRSTPLVGQFLVGRPVPFGRCDDAEKILTCAPVSGTLKIYEPGK